MTVHTPAEAEGVEAEITAEDMVEVVEIERTEGAKSEPMALTSAPGTTMINSSMNLVRKDVKESYNSGQTEMPNAMAEAEVAVAEPVQA
jgi:hypothetical protein